MDATMLIAVGLGAAFLAVALLAFVFEEVAIGRRRVNQSLRAMPVSEMTGSEVRGQELAVPFAQRVLLPGLSGLGRTALRFTPAGVVDRLDEELIYAGSPRGWDGQRVLAAKLATTAALTVGALVLLPAFGLGALRTLIIAPALAFVGYYLPEWILRSRSGKRQKQIRRALPDALDLMSITVEAGLGFDAAVERVSREMGGPLGEELYRVGQEMRLGTSRGDALRALADRTTVEELKAFVLAMVQAEIFGISVSRVLHVQADELRLKRRQAAEEQAQKLPVKIIFPLILGVFPALLVILLGPAAISIYDNIINN